MQTSANASWSGRQPNWSRMPGIREKVEAIANPLPKNIVPIANGDPTPPDLLIPVLSPQSAKRFMTAPESGGPILPIVGRKGEPSVGIDRLTGYVNCILRSQKSKHAGNFLSGSRLS